MTNKKALIALLLVALVGVIGGTFAYYTSTSKLTNEFTTGTYSTSVKEEFTSPDNWTPGTTTTKKVNVTNNGSVAIAARATYTEKWVAQDGTTLSGFNNYQKVAQFTVGEDWEQATDGWYYYKDSLNTNETSTDFISSVTFNPNFQLKEGVDIKCETIGTVGAGSVEIKCSNLDSGYGGATYTLDITIETIQSDQKWDYTAGYKKLPHPTEEELAEMKVNIGDEFSYELIELTSEGIEKYRNENVILEYYLESDIVGECLIYSDNNIYVWEDSLDDFNNALGTSITEEGWYELIENETTGAMEAKKLLTPPTMPAEWLDYITVKSESYFLKVISVE